MGIMYVEWEAFGYKNEELDALLEQKTKLRKLVDSVGIRIVDFQISVPTLTSMDRKHRES